MKYLIISRAVVIFLVIFTGSISTAFAVGLTGTYTVYSGGNYATIAAAITSLNANGVAGPVIFNIGVPGSATSYTETITAPLSISIATLLPTATNTVTFQKNPTNTGANPLVTAYVGTNTPTSATQDGIWRILGADYITINGIDLRDPNTTGAATMEYGYALYKTSATNGCQNITIRNCTITLSRYSDNANVGVSPAPVAAAGILVTNATATAATTIITVTAATGANSNNRFYTNTIQQCTTGIAIFGFAGNTTTSDTGNDIGGSAASTGNTLINFGGTAGAALIASAVTTGDQQNLNVNYNTIDNNNGSGADHVSTLRGILINAATSANTTVTFNSISLTAAGNKRVVAGIENISGSTANANTVNVSNNTINGSSFTTATTDAGPPILSGDFYGITNSGSPATLTINNNSVTNTTYATTGTSTAIFYAIYNSGAATTANINSNTITGNSVNGTTTGTSAGIINTAACGTLNINTNTIASFSTSAATIKIYPISNTGAVTTAININQNNIGTSGLACLTFSAANSGAQILINNAGGAAATTLSISNNNFYTLTYAVAGSGANTYISNVTATKSQAISNNVFNNFTVNTTGSINFIANNVTLSATGTQNINSNSISGTFSKTGAGGTLTIASAAVTSATGAVINHNSNNFSGITVTGATIVAGWAYTDAGSPTYTAQNNIFNNWTGGSSAVTAMNINITGNANAITANQVSNITAAAALTGITTSAGNSNIFANSIFSLTSTAAAASNAVSVTGGATQEVYKNKIYDIDNSNAGGTVNGILVSAGTTVNVYNNIIGDLKTPAATGTDVIRGISITSVATSAINVYYNTIYISATSTGTNFGTTGLYHAASATAGTATLTLRNNSITNTSTAKGTGLTVAYRRSANTLGNYASASNNNHFYAGTPSAANLIFTDGTTPQQTLANYKGLASLSPRDQASVTEDLSTKFLTLTPASASYLHINNRLTTAIKGAAVNITGYTDDFDSQVRAGNTGYTGSGIAPDIGADEILYTNGWLGVTSTDWNVASNWAGGVPAADSDVDIPTGKTNYPVLTAGLYPLNNINVRSGGSLTLTAGTLQIGGGITTGGTFTVSALGGTVEMNGTTAQTIPAAAFAANTVNNLKVNNSTGVTLAGTLNVTGILTPASGVLTTGGFLTLVSSATQTALIDGTGTGSVSGNVVMQRYLASAYGYKYISSPMQAATVGSFSSLVDLAAIFPNFYTYIESNVTSGFTSYTTTTNVLTPLKGYAVDFGASATPATINITGAVNNGALSTSLSNTNQTYTQGFNLVGNPYPSPIDWNASSGWTKTNIDNAIYYFDSGTTSQYTGTYSTYINGVSSDGVANNILASMQGFFVHVTNGTFPVTGTLGLTNAVRVNNLSPVFHKSTAIANNTVSRTLIRLSAGFSGDDKSADPIVLYTDTGAAKVFDKRLDAIKLLNTNDQVPNFYMLAKQALKLAITALKAIDTATSIPLSLHTSKAGTIDFNLLAAENLPAALNVYLYDSKINKSTKLTFGTNVSVNLASGDYDGRFSLKFEPYEQPVADHDIYYLYRKDGKVFAHIELKNNESGNLSLIGITGNVLSKQTIAGNGIYDLGSPKTLGIYVVSFVTSSGIHAKKIFVPE